ncbi:MAG TPA: methylenetetrahydrofolate--tRNA-(uracil(54)-C(5))-methyltransferase (FADH(2)-oxidizing) TrmFO [Firmicutes bacterium]|jgi:methylenetetrahydrofolate--tRNA-(uracil-5-)-methyltransferase|nr:methylenetetrahydrofolate--tRNA-(uracil(54)-C(5))-methyltransferase (FADH(2)-oxidizing) TrmFO [Bacillota bacterium]
MGADTVITVIGAGLAGSEAAWQAAQMGVPVTLVEMRPIRSTPAHQTAYFAELVCSNSLGGNHLSSPAGALKEEMRRLGSLTLAVADNVSIPAGGALAVDRDAFSAEITRRIEAHPLITIKREEADRIPVGICVVATGPLTSDALAKEIQALTGAHDLYFYDAAAPVITLESVDAAKAFWAGRWGKGGADYLNCPLDKEEYLAFHAAISTAQKHEGHIDEPLQFFAGCMPVEEIAARGVDTLRFGPMRPVGLIDPRTQRRPYAVVQLRRENAAGSLLNMVGFQTRMTWPEQRRVFRMIPGLAQAEFVRYGVMHRNTFLNSPRILRPTYQWRGRDELFFAGQMVGVEGYMESACSGIMAGRNAARLARGLALETAPPDTMIGALTHYITSADPENFQPMNANYGLLPPYPGIKGRAERKQAVAQRALASLEMWLAETDN